MEAREGEKKGPSLGRKGGKGESPPRQGSARGDLSLLGEKKMIKGGLRRGGKGKNSARRKRTAISQPKEKNHIPRRYLAWKGMDSGISPRKREKKRAMSHRRHQNVYWGRKIIRLNAGLPVRGVLGGEKRNKEKKAFSEDREGGPKPTRGGKGGGL